MTVQMIVPRYQINVMTQKLNRSVLHRVIYVVSMIVNKLLYILWCTKRFLDVSLSGELKPKHRMCL